MDNYRIIIYLYVDAKCEDSEEVKLGNIST